MLGRVLLFLHPLTGGDEHLGAAGKQKSRGKRFMVYTREPQHLGAEVGGRKTGRLRAIFSYTEATET